MDDEATEREIKRAYRKLSMKWHPDKNKGNADAVAKFQTITKAYEILSDGDKKALYDAGGMEQREMDEVALTDLDCAPRAPSTNSR